MVGEFTGGSCQLQGMGSTRQSTKPGRGPEAGSSAVAWGAGGHKKVRVAEAQRGRQAMDIGKAREAGRVQIMKMFKPAKGFKHGSDVLRIIL